MALKQSILLVDDDPGFLEALSEALAQAGYRVTTATDALQAAIQAEAIRPRLILTDIHMPTFGTGVGTYERLRKNPRTRDIPIIFLTGMPKEEAAKLMPKDPLIRLLFKPLNLVMLEQAIQELLGEERPLE